MLRWILTIVQLFSAVAIIGLVLLQRGKGAEAGAGFGAGASGTVFGARGATTALSRATAVLAAIFMINSLALAYMGTRPAEAPKTILDEASTRQPSVPGGTRAAPAPPADTGASAPPPHTPPTAGLAAIFTINTLALASMGTRPAEAPKTILDEASTRQPSVPGGTRAPAAPPAATGAPAPTPTTPPAPASTPAPRPAPK